MALNKTQMNIIDDSLHYIFADICRTACKPLKSKIALKFLGALSEPSANFSDAKYNDFRESINQLQAILNHPCPQNQKLSNPYYQQRAGYCVYPIYSDKGEFLKVQYEQPGLLSLTRKNETVTNTVSSDDVKNYILEQIAGLIKEIQASQKYQGVFIINNLAQGLKFLGEKNQINDITSAIEQYKTIRELCKDRCGDKQTLLHILSITSRVLDCAADEIVPTIERRLEIYTAEENKTKRKSKIKHVVYNNENAASNTQLSGNEGGSKFLDIPSEQEKIRLSSSKLRNFKRLLKFIQFDQVDMARNLLQSYWDIAHPENSYIALDNAENCASVLQLALAHNATELAYLLVRDYKIEEGNCVNNYIQAEQKLGNIRDIIQVLSKSQQPKLQKGKDSKQNAFVFDKVTYEEKTLYQRDSGDSHVSDALKFLLFEHILTQICNQLRDNSPEDLNAIFNNLRKKYIEQCLGREFDETIKIYAQFLNNKFTQYMKEPNFQDVSLARLRLESIRCLYVAVGQEQEFGQQKSNFIAKTVQNLEDIIKAGNDLNSVSEEMEAILLVIKILGQSSFESFTQQVRAYIEDRLGSAEIKSYSEFQNMQECCKIFNLSDLSAKLIDQKKYQLLKIDIAMNNYIFSSCSVDTNKLDQFLLSYKAWGEAKIFAQDKNNYINEANKRLDHFFATKQNEAAQKLENLELLFTKLEQQGNFETKINAFIQLKLQSSNTVTDFAPTWKFFITKYLAKLDAVVGEEISRLNKLGCSEKANKITAALKTLKDGLSNDEKFSQAFTDAAEQMVINKEEKIEENLLKLRFDQNTSTVWDALNEHRNTFSHLFNAIGFWCQPTTALSNVLNKVVHETKNIDSMFCRPPLI